MESETVEIEISMGVRAEVSVRGTGGVEEPCGAMQVSADLSHAGWSAIPCYHGNTSCRYYVYIHVYECSHILNLLCKCNHTMYSCNHVMFTGEKSIDYCATVCVAPSFSSRYW